jgi:hypothetical protein
MADQWKGADWWRQSLTLQRLAGRRVVSSVGLLGSAAVGLGGCFEWGDVRSDDGEMAQRAEEMEASMAALELQRTQGWDVGRPEVPLIFPGEGTTDIAGGEGWRAAMESLAGRLAPSQAALVPWYVPTLFQSLIGPTGQSLRARMRPMRTPEMDDDFARGAALHSLFGDVDFPRDTALVVDVPGPRALAIAAAVADRFEPVFTFGNWPHPLGVVPAHQTIAAALYYLPLYESARALRPAGAPPVFVLDANRLLPYSDEDSQFDNRYFVNLPDADALGRMGIKHVLYVGASRIELDDLNQAFVALCHKGVDVRLVALDDFQRADADGAVAAAPSAPAEEGDDAEPDPEVQPWPAVGYYALGPLPLFWWRGHPYWRYEFWASYGGWYVPRRPPGIRVGPPPGVRHPRAMIAVAYRPAPRATVFAPLGGRAFAQPTRFGTVPVRTSRLDGHVIGIRPGRSFGGGASSGGFGRSGSIGRAGGFSGG